MILNEWFLEQLQRIKLFVITSKIIIMTKAHSKPCQTSKMELSAKIVNGFQSLTIFAKSSILDFDRLLNTPLDQ